MKEEQKRKLKEQRNKMESLRKVSPSFHLYDQEYIPGKGMKNGGHGSLLIGDHYARQLELEKQR